MLSLITIVYIFNNLRIPTFPDELKPAMDRGGMAKLFRRVCHRRPQAVFDTEMVLQL